MCIRDSPSASCRSTCKRAPLANTAYSPAKAPLANKKNSTSKRIRPYVIMTYFWPEACSRSAKEPICYLGGLTLPWYAVSHSTTPRVSSPPQPARLVVSFDRVVLQHRLELGTCLLYTSPSP